LYYGERGLYASERIHFSQWARGKKNYQVHIAQWAMVKRYYPVHFAQWARAMKDEHSQDHGSWPVERLA
jgi:hypothetical protein